MDRGKIAEKLVEDSRIKKEYNKPKLFWLGKVSELTAGGSLKNAEWDGQSCNNGKKNIDDCPHT